MGQGDAEKLFQEANSTFFLGSAKMTEEGGEAAQLRVSVVEKDTEGATDDCVIHGQAQSDKPRNARRAVSGNDDCIDDEFYYDDDEEDEDEDWGDEPRGFEDFSVSRVSQKGYQPLERALEQKYSKAIHLEDLHGTVQVGHLPSSFSGVLKESEKKATSQMYTIPSFLFVIFGTIYSIFFSIAHSHVRRVRMREKKDRATSEQCLDPRTRLILYKMLNQEIVSEINGCLSTGKEVFHHIGVIEVLTLSSLGECLSRGREGRGDCDKGVQNFNSCIQGQGQVREYCVLYNEVR